MGCVSYSLAYFPDASRESRMKKAEIAARQELASLVREYRELAGRRPSALGHRARAGIHTARERFAEDGITLEGWSA